jgi:hypothetical protein
VTDIIIPSAISSQLDDGGAERIHIANGVEGGIVVRPPWVVPPTPGYVAWDISVLGGPVRFMPYTDSTVGAAESPSWSVPMSQFYNVDITDNGYTLGVAPFFLNGTTNDLFYILEYASGAFTQVTSLPTGANVRSKSIGIVNRGSDSYTICIGLGSVFPTITPAMMVYDWDGATTFTLRTLTPNDTTNTRGINDCCISSTGTYIAEHYSTDTAVNSWLRLFKRDGSGNYNSVNSVVSIAFSTEASVAFSSNDEHLAVVDRSTVGMKVFKIVADDLVQIFADAATSVSANGAISYSQDGAWLAVGDGTFPSTLKIYSISGDTYTLVSSNATPEITDLETVTDVKYFKGGTKLIMSCQVTNYLNKVAHIYTVNADGSLTPDSNFNDNVPTSSSQVYSLACAAAPTE